MPATNRVETMIPSIRSIASGKGDHCAVRGPDWKRLEYINLSRTTGGVSTGTSGTRL